MVSFLLIGIYAVASIALLAYGINCYVLVALFLRRRRSQAAASAAAIAAAAPRFEPPADLPLVATQIPLFNEANVAERAIRAVAAIDYPRDRHEIQVLDDSQAAVDGRRRIQPAPAVRRLRPLPGRWTRQLRPSVAPGELVQALPHGCGNDRALPLQTPGCCGGHRSALRKILRGEVVRLDAKSGLIPIARDF